MAKKHHPRRGSLQFWPHTRSKKHTARVRDWAPVTESKVLGFVGYKVGMTHVLAKEENKNSPRKTLDVFTPVTIIECPPMKVYSIRYYKRNENYALQLISEVFSKKHEKELSRRLVPSKKQGTVPEQFDAIRITAYTQPKLLGIGKKKPDLVELGVGGKTLEEKSSFAQTLLDGEIKVSDVLKEQQWIDSHSVTKGKGFTGVVKKFGVKTLQHKSEKGTRGIGTLGAWHPNQVQFTVAQSGKWGYHLRTEYNKTCMKVSDKPEEINPKGGFVRYGLVKNDYILVKGSIAGASKRPITLTEAIRPKKKLHASPISHISLESRQR